MTVKQRMAEGVQPSDLQKPGESHQNKDRNNPQGASDLMQAVVCKLLPSGDINIPKHHRSDSGE